MSHKSVFLISVMYSRGNFAIDVRLCHPNSPGDEWTVCNFITSYMVRISHSYNHHHPNYSPWWVPLVAPKGTEFISYICIISCEGTSVWMILIWTTAASLQDVAQWHLPLDLCTCILSVGLFVALKWSCQILKLYLTGGSYDTCSWKNYMHEIQWIFSGWVKSKVYVIIVFSVYMKQALTPS